MKKRQAYSDLRQQPRIDLREAVPLAMPLSMYIDPSSACNYRCVFCPHSKDKSVLSASMDLASFTKIISDIKSMGRLKTCNLFSYGEPLLNPLTPTFLKLAVDNGIAEKYVITTNASLLNEQTARQLVDNGLSFLRVSIYGASTRTYRERTGSKADIEQILSNLRFLKRYRDQVGGALSIAVKMLDSGDPEENDAFLKSFGAYGDECFLEPLHNWHDDEGRYAAVLPLSQRQVCPYPFYTLVVHADLAVSVCCPDWNKKILVGDLKTQSLADIWHGEKIFAVQRSLLAGDYSNLGVCAGCSFYKISAGDTLDGLSPEEFAARR